MLTGEGTEIPGLEAMKGWDLVRAWAGIMYNEAWAFGVFRRFWDRVLCFYGIAEIPSLTFNSSSQGLQFLLSFFFSLRRFGRQPNSPAQAGSSRCVLECRRERAQPWVPTRLPGGFTPAATAFNLAQKK